MKFGVCMDAFDAMEDCPRQADYIELSASQIYALAPDEMRRLKEKVRLGEIVTYSANNLVDASIRLTGPDVDIERILNYCEETFSRLEELGITMLVFGSGKSRQVPEGFPMETAWEQLFEVGRILADQAKLHNQTVVVEPLAYQKVNIIHTVEDGVRYARAVDRDNFKVLVDFYHFESNGEPYASLQENREMLLHTHFATAKTRVMPRSEEEWDFFSENLSWLRRIGYTGAMSFEGGRFPARELDAMLLRMKEIDSKMK